MITDKLKFLNLAKQQKINCALKSFSDTILFYYLGYLASNQNNGEISEIGVGGSTYPLFELAESTNKTFFIFDNDRDRINNYPTKAHHWPGAKFKLGVDDSLNLHNYPDIPKFSYCHSDGSKLLNTVKSDIDFYLNHLSTNGLICQDDYGNNKWPTITDTVKQFESENKIKIILIGDSSAWITKPEYYDYWMTLLKSDYEFNLLRAFCNIVSSCELNQPSNYLFLQSLISDSLSDDYTSAEHEYFNNLTCLSQVFESKELNVKPYLQMPYKDQSCPGYALKNNIGGHYKLSDVYTQLKGPDWPDKIPMTKKDIEKLPDWIKQELQDIHNFNIFKRVIIRNERNFNDHS